MIVPEPNRQSAGAGCVWRRLLANVCAWCRSEQRMAVARLAAAVLAFVLTSAYLLVALVEPELAQADTPAISPERQSQLEDLLHQDCGACHGLTLKGGLGSPLTTMALSGKSEDHLFSSIQKGIPGTPMPAWEPLLDDSEIRWLVARLTSGETP